ncbi:CRAL-TRIO domain-containing protein [Coemansia spiralis]|nr:CRAL-TRIO domain-containing protein [Coemansia spiralis]
MPPSSTEPGQQQAPMTLLDHYESRTAPTAGHLGALTVEQTQKLLQLWTLVLDGFAADALPVRFSLTQPQAASADDTDITALSLEPLGPVDIAEPAKGWFSWPAAPREAERKHETVLEYMERTAHRAPVPAEFRPLFGQPLLERSVRAAFWQAATQAGDPDAWVLRFLRARKWDTGRALDMLQKTLRWRAAQGIDELTFYGESRLHYHTLEQGLAFACTRDNLNAPVIVIRVRLNCASDRTVGAMKRFTCWQIETAQQLAQASDGRITILFDLSGFARENIDIALVRTLVSLLTNEYPETLALMIIHVDSWLFSGIWALIAPILDPVVRAKIVIAKNAEEIAPYIAPENLVTEVGGKKHFEYKYVLPSEDENRCMADAAAREQREERFCAAVDRLEELTCRWVEDPQAGDGERTEAKDALKQAAAALDPYVRARSWYHRVGLIAPDNTVKL